MKCASDVSAIRASAGTSSGWAYVRSIASRERSSRRLDSSVARLTSGLQQGDIRRGPTAAGARLPPAAPAGRAEPVEVERRVVDLEVVPSSDRGQHRADDVLGDVFDALATGAD